jgi:hypothetical protein
MKVIAFITDSSVVDRIINHLKLTFVAERPPPRRRGLMTNLSEIYGKMYGQCPQHQRPLFP